LDTPSYFVVLKKAKFSELIREDRVEGKKKVKLSLFLTKHHADKTYWGSVGIAPSILNLCIKRGRMISFTPRSLRAQYKSSRWYPFDRGL
jgi:hypothetical protein